MPKLFSILRPETEAELKRNAEYLVQPGKGILAADEPAELLDRRFAAAGLDNTPENRRLYRQILFATTNEAFPNHISGVILQEDTFYQKTDDGVRFVDLLTKRGIMPGITVDKGLVPVDLATSDGQTITQGLDSLAERCAKFKKDGAVFAKWRSAFVIGQDAPTHRAILENCRVLARYAMICQQNGLVPIVEPDISQDGSHDLATCQKVTEQILSFAYKVLSENRVFLEGTLLKPNMVTPGSKCPQRATPEEIAEATVTALQRRVPAAVPGVGFLSGGQSELEATLNLNAINRWGDDRRKKPWALTFIFGRALQNPVAGVWAGKTENIGAAQEVFARLIQNNGQASLGNFK